MMQLALPELDAGSAVDRKLIDAFLANDIHPVLARCSELRPSVDIAILQ
jgi:hypothetical protein